MILAVDRGDPLPAEEDIGCGLHHPLPLDDALPVLLEPALAEERLEHRLLRLLELEEQRIGVVAAHEEQDPGAGPNAADADDLARRVDVPVALQQLAPVLRQAELVGADHALHDVLEMLLLGARQHVLDRGHDRMAADDAQLAGHRSTHFRERSHAVLGADGGDAGLEALHLLVSRP